MEKRDIPATSKSENMDKQIFKNDKSGLMKKNNIHYIIQMAKLRKQHKPKVIKEEEKQIEDYKDINSFTFKAKIPMTHHIKKKKKRKRPFKHKFGLQINTQEIQAIYQKRQELKSRKTPQNFGKKESTPQSEKTTDKARPKQQPFGFAQSIFDPSSPMASPNRGILFIQFLKERLGKKKYEKMKVLLDKSHDPMRILTHQKWLVESIIGKSNMDCIRIFKFLISSSVTPVGWQQRGKKRSFKFKKSPKNQEMIEVQKQ